MWCQKRSALLPATVISPRLPPPRCTSRLLIMMRPSPLWLLQYWSGTDAEERREDRVKTSPDIRNEARRLFTAPVRFFFFIFFFLLFRDINLTTEFSVQLPLVVIIDQSLTAIPYSCFMQSNRSRPHTAPFKSEMTNTSCTQWQTLCYLKIGASLIQVCISNHKVKGCFPLIPTTGSGTLLCCDAAGLIFRVALNGINKMTFLFFRYASCLCGQSAPLFFGSVCVQLLEPQVSGSIAYYVHFTWKSSRWRYLRLH